jgi:hypothetical protein
MSQTTLEWLLLPFGVWQWAVFFTLFGVIDCVEALLGERVTVAGMKFDMFETNDEAYYPKIWHLGLSIPIALLLSLFRKFVVEG